MVAALKRYARRMGVNPTLVGAAEALPPGTVHVLTRDEMRRWSFAGDGDREEAQDSQGLSLQTGRTEVKDDGSCFAASDATALSAKKLGRGPLSP